MSQEQEDQINQVMSECIGGLHGAFPGAQHFMVLCIFPDGSYGVFGDAPKKLGAELMRKWGREALMGKKSTSTRHVVPGIRGTKQ